MVLFIMLYKVVLIFESVDKILKCDHSIESYWAVLSCGNVYYMMLHSMVLTYQSVVEQIFDLYQERSNRYIHVSFMIFHMWAGFSLFFQVIVLNKTKQLTISCM